jgi:hypothetical protein
LWKNELQGDNYRQGDSCPQIAPNDVNDDWKNKIKIKKEDPAGKIGDYKNDRGPSRQKFSCPRKRVKALFRSTLTCLSLWITSRERYGETVWRPGGDKRLDLSFNFT